MQRQRSLVATAVVFLAVLPLVACDALLPSSFSFDYKPESQTFRVPTTEQCETLNIKWSRGAATGPDPSFPYFLRIYTPITDKPLIVPAGNGPMNEFNFTLPHDFAPQTVYQMCMVDAQGNSGGCLDQYSVVPSTSGIPASCVNATFAPATLPVNFTADGHAGPASTNGFFDQCSSLHVTPLAGTPPFTLTIAPSLHPPFNITTNKLETVSWQIDLSWGLNFWISMSDSTGVAWSAGPMHAGGPGSTDCLATRRRFSGGDVAGASVGSLLAGCLLGLIPFVISHLRMKRREVKTSQLGADLAHSAPVTPFVFSHRAVSESGHGSGHLSEVTSTPPVSHAPQRYQMRSNTSEKVLPAPPMQVFVYHQDSGTTSAMPAELVDLPPTYNSRHARPLLSLGSPTVIGTTETEDDTGSPSSHIFESPRSLSGAPLVLSTVSPARTKE